jgi:succinylarginine dihydrolase
MPRPTPTAVEVNFDGLVGPTHNYSGLSQGNLASTTNRASVSNPRAAVLQGIEKAKSLMDGYLVESTKVC